MFKVVEAWTVLDEDGLYTNIYESEETLYRFEGDADVEQGYVIIDEDTGLIPEGFDDFYDDYYDAMMDMIRMEGGVFVAPDCVAIFDVNEEIIFWDKSEWEEDPTVTTSIVNAIRIFYEQGSYALKEAIGNV